MASTGSNLEAEIAGKIPEINPIVAAKLVPKIIFPTPNTNSKSSIFVSITDIIHTKSNPIALPKTQRITASNRN